MKRYALLAVLAMLLPISDTARSQSADNSLPPSTSNPSSTPDPLGPGGERLMTGKRFQEFKTEVLERLGERLSVIQKRQACVEAATDGHAVVACLPKTPEGFGNSLPLGTVQNGSSTR